VLYWHTYSPPPTDLPQTGPPERANR
jgi:hypothetical protein